ncbi:MAG: AMP-binding protein [Actinomycetota bacterium]
MADGPLARATSLVDVLNRAGILDPRRVPALSLALARWGPTVAAPYTASAISHPMRAAVIDDDGEVSFFRLDRDSTATAMGLHRRGLRRGDDLGVACRNHREFVEVTIAAAKAGLGVVYLNTSFGAPQLNEVLARESVAGLVVDSELLELVDIDAFAGPIVVTDLAATPTVGPSDLPVRTVALEDVRDHRPLRLPLRPSLPVPPILLTSGTTGTPKGARRTTSGVDATAAAGLFNRIPYRHDDVVAITSPLFHAWGLAQLGLAAALGCTASVSRRFDADDTLGRVETDGATVLAVVPAILQRLLASPRLADSDLSTLRIVASSGSALPVPVVEEWHERVAVNLYNLYGSTEVGQASLATPAELADEPATAGRVLDGSVVAILDDDGAEVPPGETGRIFVGNAGQFDHYTGGGGKEIVDGLMSSGDVGHLRDDGLLFVTGRADDMIVSGGENVFPQEVEDLLLAHPEIDDAAVVGVDDESLGQRLVAHVVLVEGSSLSDERVRRHVSASLARHKTPRDVYLVDELPRTATGKLRRRDLAS